jgi:hypothetical protein
MTDYIPPDPSVAEWVYQQRAAEKERARRLQSTSPQQLKHLVRDRNEPTILRASAMSKLAFSSCDRPLVPFSCRGDPEVPDILLGLLSEPEPEMRRLALQFAHFCWSDPRVVEKVRSLLDDTDLYVYAEAAMVLARKRDKAVLPYLLTWFHGGDEPHRNMATACLRFMKTPEAHRALRESWEQGGRSEWDRVGLASALLWSGDSCGVPFLEEVARRADGVWSGVAATALYGTSAYHAEGLKLMRWVLDHGTLEAKQWMVGQIYNLARPLLEHAFTADGIHEARCWIDQHLQETATRRPG